MKFLINKSFHLIIFIIYVHFPSSLRANLISSMYGFYPGKSIEIDPTTWQLRKTRKILRELGYDDEYFANPYSSLVTNDEYGLAELANIVDDPAMILNRSDNDIAFGGTFDEIRGMELHQHFFYATFNPRKKKQHADSLFETLKRDIDRYVEDYRNADDGDDFFSNVMSFSEETGNIRSLRKSDNQVVVKEWVEETRMVKDGLSEYSAKFDLADFQAILVSRFDEIAQSAASTDAPGLLRKYLSEFYGREITDEEVIAIFASPCYRPSKGDIHNFMISRVVSNEEAFKDERVILKLWKFPGTKRGETRAHLRKHILEKKQSLNVEDDPFSRALFVAANENRRFAKFLNDLLTGN